MSAIETTRCGQDFSTFSQPLSAEVSNPQLADPTAKFVKNASNSTAVSFANIPTAENDKTCRKLLQGLASNSKVKDKVLHPNLLKSVNLLLVNTNPS